MQLLIKYIELLKRPLQGLFTVFVILMILPGLVSAFEPIPFLPVNYLMNEAKKSYENKEYTKSINFLSQVLQSNPNYRSAQNLLIQMTESGQINEQEKADIVAFQDANLLNNNLIVKINYYIQRRNEVLGNLAEKGYEVKYLNNELIDFQLELIQLHEKTESKKRDILTSGSLSLQQLVQISLLKKDELLVELDNIKKQFEHVRSLNKDHVIDQPVVDIIVSSTENSNPVLKDQSDLQNQVITLRKDLVALQELVQERNVKIDQLTKSLAELTNQKSKVNVLESVSTMGAPIAQDDFNDLQSRFELSQKIIQQKDKEIESLKAQLTNPQELPYQYTEPKNFSLPSRTVVEEQLIEISGILEIYKSKHSDVHNTLKTNSIYMHELEERLASVQTKLFEKDQLFQKTEQNLLKLEQKLLELQSELDNLRQSQLNTKSFFQKEGVSLQHQLNNIHEFLAAEWKVFQQDDSPKKKIFHNNQIYHFELK